MSSILISLLICYVNFKINEKDLVNFDDWGVGITPQSPIGPRI